MANPKKRASSPEESPPSHVSHSSSTIPLEVLQVFFGSLGILAHLQWLCPWVIGADGYFHQKMAMLIRDHGAVHEFPWTQTSIFRDHFSDSSFLFHVLLIPFTWITDDVTAIKLGAVFFSSLFFAGFYLFLRSNRCRAPLFFTLILASSGSLLLYRLCQCRGYLLSMLLTLIAVDACLNRRLRLLFFVSVLYSLSYTACHTIVVLALLHNIAQFLTGERVERRLVPATVAGVLVGLCIHPNFPNTFYLWWVQNVRVLALKWGGSVNLFFGGELYPPDTHVLLFSTTAVFLTVVVCSLITLLNETPRSTNTVSLFLLALGFGILTLLSKRFIEYSAPLWVAYAAFLVRDVITDDTIQVWRSRQPVALTFSIVGALVLQTALLCHSYVDVRRDLRNESKPNMMEPALWLKANSRPGDIVYTCDWDDMPELFYYNDKNRYLVCLDPAFFYEFDPQLWLRWFNVSNGYAPDSYSSIRYDFGARFLLATSQFTNILKKANDDPRFQKRFEQAGVTIYELGEDLDFLTDWSISGYYPRDTLNMDGKILAATSIALDSRLGLKPFVRWPHQKWGSFIDLERLFDGPEDCFAYAVCTIDSPVDQSAELRMGLDDALTVWLHGRQVFSDPGPSEVSLDGRKIGIILKKGANTLVLRCTNYKKRWGFCARLVGLSQPVKSHAFTPRTRE